jgi:hypothetical protein
MAIGTVNIGGLEISRLIVGGNPFSGVSHQTPQMDMDMKRYFTADHIKQTLHSAEELGITTFIGRADRHITRLLFEYWEKGGTLQWVAQTCPEMASISRSIDDALSEGAGACYIHGGVMDNLLSRGELKEIPDLIRKIRDTGLPAGIAGHNPKVFEWAEDHLDVDFYMCSYYNSSSRDKDAEMHSGRPEWFLDSDRDIMVKLIQKLKRPAIHYKILAAGRKKPQEAFEFTARHLRPGDAACVGIYPEHKPEMLVEDAALFTKYVGR